ncbi:MAG TPA: stage II sporulation protein M [Caulobacter sp.]|nr:stage II sporulation protein M [Caulobacter sp.]
MAVLQLKSHQFRQEREADWRRLSFLLEKVEERGPKSLTDDQLLAIPVLYRSALSSLSVARATSLDQSLVDYLEGLCARAYFVVYGARPRIGQRIAGYFTQGWSARVRSIWKETLVSAAITILAAVVGFMMVAQNPDWFYAMVPADMAGDRGPTASAASLRATLYDTADTEELSAFAAELFSHNAQISLFAFALGFAFCVPTAMLLMSNGVLLGAMIQVFAAKGLGLEFAGWLMIHGVTELLAIILAGAAGFKIGLAVAFPGERTRLDAAAEAGRASGAVMAGVVIMLLLAGLLEGLGRQMITSDAVRYAIGIGSGVIWLAYFYLPRPRGLAPGREEAR